MDKAVEAAFQTWFGGVDDGKRNLPYAKFIRQQLEKCLTAADEARAVSDEEVVAALGQAIETPITAFQALKTAGLKVVLDV